MGVRALARREEERVNVVSSPEQPPVPDRGFTVSGVEEGREYQVAEALPEAGVRAGVPASERVSPDANQACDLQVELYRHAEWNRQQQHRQHRRYGSEPPRQPTRLWVRPGANRHLIHPCGRGGFDEAPAPVTGVPGGRTGRPRRGRMPRPYRAGLGVCGFLPSWRQSVSRTSTPYFSAAFLMFAKASSRSASDTSFT